MDFQNKQITLISIACGILLIFHGIIENKSSEINNNIFLEISKKNIESLDLMLLSRIESIENDAVSTLAIKKVLLEKLETKISGLVLRSSKLDKYLNVLILSIVLINFSVYFPLSRGNELKDDRKMFFCYKMILAISLIISILSILFSILI